MYISSEKMKLYNTIKSIRQKVQRLHRPMEKTFMSLYLPPIDLHRINEFDHNFQDSSFGTSGFSPSILEIH
jgi:hypothetical protein